jgi:hypothetical protein
VGGGLVATQQKRVWKITPLVLHLDTHYRKDVRYVHTPDAAGELVHTILVGIPRVQRVYRFGQDVVAFMKASQAQLVEPKHQRRPRPTQRTRLVSEAVVLATISAYVRKRAAAEAAAAPKRARRRSKAKTDVKAVA